VKPRPAQTSRAFRGFTLIELIGVLAILAILAATIAPNALRSIDRAAVTAERTNLENLGEQVKLYLRANGTLPTSSNWTTTVGAFADIAPADIQTNKRGMTRVYLADPATNPAQRVLLISSMRNGVTVPTTANTAQFAAIWNTADGRVPATTGWNGWSNTPGLPNSAADYLVIRRVNLSGVYNTDLQSLTITLNNRGSSPASYVLVPAGGTAQAAVNIPAGATAIITPRRPRDQINLYRAANGATLDYSYVLSATGKTFDFNGTNWIPQ